MVYKNLFIKWNQDSHIAKALKVIRTSIYFSIEKEDKVILFTSSIPKEGRSTIAANFALSVALSGKKALFIDCDTRKPKTHTKTNVKVELGFEDILLGRKTIADVLIRDVKRNLDILPSNHNSINVTELYFSEPMRHLLRTLKKRYDIIVMDTPPLMATTDAAILSEYADGVVYIVGYNMVSKKELIACKKILHRFEDKIIGSIVNKIDRSGYSYGNHGYYNYNYNL